MNTYLHRKYVNRESFDLSRREEIRESDILNKANTILFNDSLVFDEVETLVQDKKSDSNPSIVQSVLKPDMASQKSLPNSSSKSNEKTGSSAY